MPPTKEIPQIAVWGASNVGKTTFLAGAMLALQTFYGWSWLIGGEGEERERTTAFIKSEIAKLQGGRMVSSNDPEKEPERYIFKLEQKGDRLGRTGRYHEISVVDVAGGLIEDMSDRRRYFETLRKSRGILMLFDPNLKSEYQAAAPQSSETNYYELLTNLLVNLQDTHAHGARLDMPLAICLTKMDQDEHWRYRGQPKAYLRETLGDTTFAQLTTFTCKEFFAISTVGRFKDPKDDYKEKSNLDPDPNRNSMLNFGVWEPYCLTDPLFWLLDHLERERESEFPWWRQPLRRLVRKPNYHK